jgi:hypothetical protein
MTKQAEQVTIDNRRWGKESVGREIVGGGEWSRKEHEPAEEVERNN